MSSEIDEILWENLEDLFTVVCRPALPMDTKQVMDLTQLFWDGEDYVPYVWKEWLSHSEGVLAVAEYGSNVIGIGKLSKLAAGQWWFEGLRVHPEYQGRGVGSHIHNYLLNRWLKIGDGVIRLAASASKLAVHRMSERTGFKIVAEFIPFKAGVLDEPSDEFILLHAEEVSNAVDFAIKSETLDLSSKLIDLGWRWVSMNPHNLSEAVDQQHAWWWRGKEGLVAMWEEDWEREAAAVLMFIACEWKQIVAMLIDFRSLAASLGHTWAAWFAPPHKELLPILEQAGYKRDWEDAMYVFERVYS